MVHSAFVTSTTGWSIVVSVLSAVMVRSFERLLLVSALLWGSVTVGSSGSSPHFPTSSANRGCVFEVALVIANLLRQIHVVPGGRNVEIVSAAHGRRRVSSSAIAAHSSHFTATALRHRHLITFCSRCLWSGASLRPLLTARLLLSLYLVTVIIRGTGVSTAPSSSARGSSVLASSSGRNISA